MLRFSASKTKLDYSAWVLNVRQNTQHFTKIYNNVVTPPKVPYRHTVTASDNVNC